MGIVTPTNTVVLGFNGLHLYHYAMSNCSQKVRMCLAEKGLDWTSHHLDLAQNEHVTPEYMRINPHEVVPTLVHDGTVIIESSDILDYLEATFLGPPLQPSGPTELARMRGWIELWDAIQFAIKVLSHEFLFKIRSRSAKRELARHETVHHNQELVAFLREFTSPQGLGTERIRTAFRRADNALLELDDRLVDV